MSWGSYEVEGKERELLTQRKETWVKVNVEEVLRGGGKGGKV